MIAPLSSSQVDRLGERLRSGGDISDADLDLLQQFRGRHASALAEVQARIQRALPDAEQTARIKTIQTITDKLRRQPTKLSRVQDIAGVRIVAEADLAEQDHMVSRLVREFPDAKTIDRRASPTHGYRAVHVVVRVDGCWCEIQVRSTSQHVWAEVVERLADRWGRQIRYGEPPEDPSQAFGGGMTRGEFWDLVREMSDTMHGVEELATLSRLALESGQGPSDLDAAELDDLRTRSRTALTQLRDLVVRGAEL